MSPAPKFNATITRAAFEQFVEDVATAAAANGMDMSLAHEILRDPACCRDFMDVINPSAGAVQTGRFMATVDAYNADPVRRSERGPLFTEA
jgi:hypothetical protein